MSLAPRRFVHGVRADLRRRRWLRWHCFLIGCFTLLAAWGGSHALMLMRVDHLGLRYGLAFAVAYAVFLGLLYLWARWLLSRDDGNADWLQIDGGGGGSPGSGGSSTELPGFKSGGGGDFGGAGGGGSFDLPEGSQALTEGGSELAGAALEAAGSADEGIVVLVPLIVVIGVALALAATIGGVVFGLFGVEVLLGVAVEIALASVGGALAYKAGAEGWLAFAWRRTRWSALAVLIAVVLGGAAIDHWVPEARSAPHALKLLRSAAP